MPWTFATMHEPAVKRLTGNARLVVVDEVPAEERMQFTFAPDAKLWISTCERPFMSDVEPLETWRRLVPTDG